MDKLRVFLVPLLMVALLGVAMACGDDDDDDDGQPTATAEPTEGGGESPTDTPSQEPEIIQVGFLGDETGACTLGAAISRGAQLGAQAVNDAGGFEVNGQLYNFEVVVRDSRCDESVQIANAREFADDLGLKFVLGPCITGAVSTLAITQPAEMIHMGCTTAIEPEMAKPENSFLFRSTLSPRFRDVQRWQGIHNILDSLSIPFGTVAMVQPDNDTGRSTATAFVASAEAEGAEVVGTEFHAPGVPDFSGILTSFDHVNMLVMTFIAADQPTLIRQAEELDVTDSYIFQAGDPAIIEDTFGGAIDKPAIFALGPPSVTQPSSDRVASVVEAYKELFSLSEVTGADNFMFYYYDTMFMLAEAMKEAGTVDDTVAIRDALETLTIDGALGELTFGNDHLIEFPIEICLVRPGTLETECGAPEDF